MQKKLHLFLLLLTWLTMGHTANAQLIDEILTTSGTWTCPANVTSVTVQCWAGGGAGGGAAPEFAAVAGGGGGGGTFSSKTINVVPGATYTYEIGTGGIGSTQTASVAASGGDSWFENQSSVFAQGGKGGAIGTSLSTGSTAGTGGSSTDSLNIGDTHYIGGQGASGAPDLESGGGGGGGGGTDNPGENGDGKLGGYGGIDMGGRGGQGGDSNNPDGTNGNTYGGGGGGGFGAPFASPAKGGNGANGAIILTYSIDTDQPNPITIAYFNGEHTQNTNLLHLAINVINEKNASVILEKSTDGKNWSATETQPVQAKDGLQKFEFTDRNLNSNINQYRAAFTTQTQTTYSKVLSLGKSNKAFSVADLVPNPVQNNTYLPVYTPISDNMIILITDLSGRKIKTLSVDVTAGYNEIQMNFSGLNAGTYQISVTNTAGNVSNTRFVKY